MAFWGLRDGFCGSKSDVLGLKGRVWGRKKWRFEWLKKVFQKSIFGKRNDKQRLVARKWRSTISHFKNSTWKTNNIKMTINAKILVKRADSTFRTSEKKSPKTKCETLGMKTKMTFRLQSLMFSMKRSFIESRWGEQSRVNYRNMIKLIKSTELRKQKGQRKWKSIRNSLLYNVPKGEKVTFKIRHSKSKGKTLIIFVYVALFLKKKHFLQTLQNLLGCEVQSTNIYTISGYFKYLP